MLNKIQVYLGYDPREDLAYEVARESIRKRCPSPLNIYPLRLSHLPMLTRPIETRDGKMWCPISEAPMSTEFAISRFCIPFLQSRGWALFADCDIVCWENIENLFNLADDKYAVMVVKHSYEPATPRNSNQTKMDGQIQTYYTRKNWSSVILWNCDHPANTKLNLERLNSWPGRDLHAFKWLENDEIGELPQKWNWLVNVTPGEPKKEGIWHWTLGGPWFEDWDAKPYDNEWSEEAATLLNKSACEKV